MKIWKDGNAGKERTRRREERKEMAGREKVEFRNKKDISRENKETDKQVNERNKQTEKQINK